MLPVSNFDTILFDLNGTLAEGYDRFGPDADYHGTYRGLGGRDLSAAALRDWIDRTLARLLPRYRDGPADPFPKLRDCLPEADRLPASELELLLETIAAHECGRIPPARVALLHALSGHHRLGLVSDLWAPAGQCRDYLADLGLGEIFGSLVFSCEHGAVKPARRLFELALAELDADPARTLFVGDDLQRDIEGAAASVLRTAWIGDPAIASGADRVLRDVLDLGG